MPLAELDPGGLLCPARLFVSRLYPSVPPSLSSSSADGGRAQVQVPCMLNGEAHLLYAKRWLVFVAVRLLLKMSAR